MLQALETSPSWGSLPPVAALAETKPLAVFGRRCCAQGRSCRLTLTIWGRPDGSGLEGPHVEAAAAS